MTDKKLKTTQQQHKTKQNKKKRRKKQKTKTMKHIYFTVMFLIPEDCFEARLYHISITQLVD